MTDEERLKATREYFESGCLCMNKVFGKLHSEVDDSYAVEFYETHCECSRNYIGNNSWFCGGCGETDENKRCVGCLHVQEEK